MNITVINGTEVKGCTYRIKETFLSSLRAGNEITEFYLPKDLPRFCGGCKTCFFKDEALCPNASYVEPIWQSLRGADLIGFAAPVYALRAPAPLKSLLDHLCCHWMAHRPDPIMFNKRAVILTNSVGAPNAAAQNDVATSLTWLGVSNIRRLGFGLMEGVIWNELSEKRRAKIEQRTLRFAEKYKSMKKGRKGVWVWLFFEVSRIIHKKVLKNEDAPSADNRYWIKKGWIKSK